MDAISSNVRTGSREKNSTPSVIGVGRDGVTSISSGTEHGSPEPEGPRDFSLYQPLLKSRSKVPVGAHQAWKEGLQQLKNLSEGE